MPCFFLIIQILFDKKKKKIQIQNEENIYKSNKYIIGESMSDRLLNFNLAIKLFNQFFIDWLTNQPNSFIVNKE